MVTYTRQCPHGPFDLCHGCLIAERDRYMAEASERQREIGRLEGERDALAAQCAALAEEAGVNPNDIPAAAAVYLAAMRACDAIDTDLRSGKIPAFDLSYGGGSDALIAWRKAAGR